MASIPVPIQLLLAIASIVGSCMSGVVLTAWASFLRRREAEETERVKHEEEWHDRLTHIEDWLLKHTSFDRAD